MDVIKIKSLAEKYQQANLRKNQLEVYLKVLEESKGCVSGIYILQNNSGVPLEITAGMDRKTISDNYLMHIINGLYDEIATHERRMEEIEQDIKKELQEEPVNK